MTVPLEDSEVAALRRALCSAEGGRSVSAERLQAWAGDRTLLQVPSPLVRVSVRVRSSGAWFIPPNR